MTRVQLLQQLKPLTVHAQWEVLEEYLDLLIEDQLSVMIHTTSWEDTKEIQGRVKAYKAIRALKDTIQTMDR